MIAKYLEELLKQKEQLVTNLRIKGVEADSSETLNTLIPKVLQIQGGSPKRQPVFVAEEFPEKYADTIYTIFQNGIQDLSGYIRNNKPFCNESNGYILNYSQADFGWDGFVCTGSTTPINVDSQQQLRCVISRDVRSVAVCFLFLQQARNNGTLFRIMFIHLLPIRIM